MIRRGILVSNSLIAISLLFAANAAWAQSANTGALTGRVTDAATGQPVAGVTVVAQGPQGEQAELTDTDGTYTLTGLVPGLYVVRYYYANVKVERPNVTIFADKKIQVNVPLQTKAATAETYTITEKAPTVDVGSTKIGTTINQDFTRNVPVGRNFDTVAEVAPGAQVDGMGVAFSGTTSAENSYVIDGINVTSIHMSQAAASSLGSALNLDFIQEVEVITGGYNAEYGRATGGIVNVITKSGSNEFHGDAAAYYDPGPLRGTAPVIAFPGSSLSFLPEHAAGDYRLDFFADLGGPIIKDRLWFYVGFEPIFRHTTTRRIVSKLVDNCDQSHNADGSVNPTFTGPCVTGTGGDGYQDFTNGGFATQELYHTLFTSSQSEYQWTAKVNLLVTPDHTLEVAYYGSPNTSDAFREQGAPGLPSRILAGSQDLVGHWISKLFDKKWQLEASLSLHKEIQEHELVDPLENQSAITWQTDPAGNVNTNSISDRQGAWSSVSWFKPYEPTNAFDANGNPVNGQDLIDQNCDVTNAQMAGSNKLPSIHPVDPASKLKIVCPIPSYTLGGAGYWENLSAQRIGARIAGTNFFRALGHHQMMYGWDPEINSFTDTRLYTGNGYIQPIQNGGSKLVEGLGWGYFKDRSIGPSATNVVPFPFKKDASGNPLCGSDNHICSATETPTRDLSQCDQVSGQPDNGIPTDASVFCADTQTINHALFFRDSWSILPNLTLNLGIRWERQSIQGIRDFENNIIGDSPIELNNNWAPRIGVIYDPTNEGKAKVYGSFARFYESIPLDINNRSFGNEGFLQNYYSYRDSTTAPRPDQVDQRGCIQSLISGGPAPFNIIGTSADMMHNGSICPTAGAPGLFGGSKSLIEPNLQGMYTDEIVVGGEYEIIEDLAIGGYYTHRNLGTIIEDGSVNLERTGTGNYYITNPGESVSQDQINTLLSRAKAANAEAMRQMGAGNVIAAHDYQAFSADLNTFADTLPYFARFEPPSRDYNALTLTAKKRFSRNWLAQASYTYARTIGNYPGIYNPYIDQKDPNISTLYDLPDVIANRKGALPIDTPHQLKIDGYYTWKLKGDNSVVTGTSFRAQSGTPRNTLGINDIYNSYEVFILPSATAGRNDFLTSWDIQLAYVRQLPRNMQLQLFFAAYNVLNESTVLSRDDGYTINYVTPIVNGTEADLHHLKTIPCVSCLNPNGMIVRTAGAVAKPNAAFGQPTSYQAPIFTRFGARFTF